ncbi:glycerol-3-phosphate dehydrogenase/oxidase [Saccharothrix yanglingensis]|uniref:Glycerol-3-phosphate dehydrogenase n=1 Tax=Saccharothrix yanglingensis TaxID=659496 RepID=A0ABU0WXE3_9PSEU|nr:glycerol-3-phosphate dehydrogenase/oxidase [Saccharothrix yanglingensis]MDQ2584525.1 glycerol-3-phosphate dehydrogenase [Saccharothrix yanglingensis]
MTTPPTTSLNASRRTRDLDHVSSTAVDLLVVGGGVTGAGVALDAASRGLSVCLLEAHDLAFGTSRWSSKLVHGGLRYLAQGEVGLAHESAVERGILMTRTAPHLVRTLPQLVPLHGRSHDPLVMAGLRAGDVLRRAARTPSRVLPPPRRVPAAEALALAPGLRRTDLRGGLLGFDGQLVDDARLVVALARTAAGFGARIVTRARVDALTPSGASATDTLTGESFTVTARAVVNAAGVWAGGLVDVDLRPSRGSHLVLAASALGLTTTALTVPVPGTRNRFALLLPQQDGRVYVGLTDEPVDGPIPDVPEVPRSDVDFLLGVASSVLDRPPTRSDVLGSFAGLRPLLAGAGASADLSRRHAIIKRDNVTTVVGGKLTTYRRMAADAVDATALTAARSRTATLPLVGAGAPTGPAHLTPRYGAEAAEVARTGEVTWAVHHEGALDAADVLDRRTRTGLVPADRAAAEPDVTRQVAEALSTLP